ncbi:hypothetical protein SFRURICE_011707, partial [Spodoptera frugiperda]
VRAPADAALVGALACRALFALVAGPGAGGARGWWGAAAARPARLLERVVALYVAPAVVREQLRELAARAPDLDDTEVEISWGAREVRAVYCVEERRLELRVWLAPAHPLVAPRLAAAGAGGAGGVQWLQLYMAQQHGSVLGALRLWTGAVCARVEAAPQCYICYCRLQPSTGRLPKVPCHQCKNKFHNLANGSRRATNPTARCAERRSDVPVPDPRPRRGVVSVYILLCTLDTLNRLNYENEFGINRFFTVLFQTITYPEPNFIPIHKFPISTC